MCGILTCLTCDDASPRTRSELDSQELDKGMRKGLANIVHRGPDSTNVWYSPDGSVALGHVRLSIIDLSPDGQQPFHDETDSIHVVVNGELYDHERIRAELQTLGHKFVSHSDSEIVLALYKEHGLDFLAHLRGEFALVLYDANTRTLIAARDRYGIKPLFYTRIGHRILFASEAKAFLGLGWQPEWDVTSLAQSGWVFDHRTPFKAVNKVRPGQYVLVDAEGSMRTEPYWDLDYPDRSSKETRSLQEMVLKTRELLLESIRLRLRADVPVAIYLSGGIDSSVVAGMAQHLIKQHHVKIGDKAHSQSPSSSTQAAAAASQNGNDNGAFASRLDCFTISFTDSEAHDEYSTAERTAEYLDAKMHKVNIAEQELADHFEQSVWHCEHATADLNFVAKAKLAEAARDAGFKVVLTGEGADETFAGYSVFEGDFLRAPDPTFTHLDNPELSLSPEARLALFKAREGAHIEELLSKRHGIFASFSTQPISLRDAVVPRKMLGGTSTCRWLTATSELPTNSLAPWVSHKAPTLDRAATYANSFSGPTRAKMQNSWHPLHTALYTEIKGTFNSILLSSLGDRVEMSASLEARTPFLDHHLTEYVNSLPPSVKIVAAPAPQQNDANTPPTSTPILVEKYLLREAAKPFVTPEIYNRRKHPYSAPIAYKPGGALHSLLVNKLLTKERVDALGWASWEFVQEAVERGFEKGEVAFLRQAFVLAQLTSLGEQFGIPPARV